MWTLGKNRNQTDNKPSELKKNPKKDIDLDKEDTFEMTTAEGEENNTEVISDNTEVTSEEDNEIILPPEPELDPPVYGLVGGVSYWGFSQRGESHIINGAPCQDRCVIDVVNSSPLIVAAIADGVGSCMLSHYGAAKATRSAVDYLKGELVTRKKSLDDSYVGDLLRSAMQCAYDAVRNEAEELEQLEYSFQSTLTLAIYDGSTLFFSHAGDDGIVAILDDGTMDLATVRKKGEEASSVLPLQSLDWETRKSTNVNAFVMATDGVLDAFVRGKKEGNRIYYPFIEPAVKPGQLTDTKVKEVADFYYSYMESSEYRAKVTDDLTMVVITNQKKIKENNLPEFDQAAWNKYSAEREAEIKAALYPANEPKRNRVKTSSTITYEDEEWESSTDNLPYENVRIFCNKCGARISLTTANFCPNCGYKLKRPVTVGNSYSVSSQPKKDDRFKSKELTSSSLPPRSSKTIDEEKYLKQRVNSSKKNDYRYSKRDTREVDFDEDRWEPGINPFLLVFFVMVMVVMLLFCLY